MAVLSLTYNDAKIAGISLAVSCAVLATMRQMLIFYRNSAIIPPSVNKPQYITQEIEDSLKISTLEKLLDSPSWVIRDTTSTIITERVLHDKSSFLIILGCITRPEYDTREKGIRALNMIINHATIGSLHSPEGYFALVQCLKYCVTDYEHNAFDPDWDNWHFRDIVEQLTLGLLTQLVEEFGPCRLLKYRFIELWLSKEPWGDTYIQRVTNFAQLLLNGTHKLCGLVFPIFKDTLGRKELYKAKLVTDYLDPSETQKIKVGEEGILSERMAGLSDDLRRREQSSTDENTRRRHREAIVMNDGSRPLGRSDIIQREP
ncbi:hypothetical protein K3495_g3092 [Podosphaera aphanis]|nr:hypothetical protein K3495_g3092 [Podosphaera aphanis]